MNAVTKPLATPFTVNEYLSWTDGERWELIDGQAFNMSPAPNIRHQELALSFASQLRDKLKGRTCQPFIAPLDVVLSEKDVVQPDVIVVCDPAKITEKNIQGAPDLVVEVLSPSTATKDLREKKAMYERAGIPEYLILDPLEEYAQVYRLETDGKYGIPIIYAPLETLMLTSVTDVEIALWEVFGYPDPALPVNQPEISGPNP